MLAGIRADQQVCGASPPFPCRTELRRLSHQGPPLPPLPPDTYIYHRTITPVVQIVPHPGTSRHLKHVARLDELRRLKAANPGKGQAFVGGPKADEGAIDSRYPESGSGVPQVGGRLPGEDYD